MTSFLSSYDGIVEVKVQASKCCNSNHNRNWQCLPDSFVSFHLFFSCLPNIHVISISCHGRLIWPESPLRSTTNGTKITIRHFLEGSPLIIYIPAITANIGLLGGHTHGKPWCSSSGKLLRRRKQEVK